MSSPLAYVAAVVAVIVATGVLGWAAETRLTAYLNRRQADAGKDDAAIAECAAVRQLLAAADLAESRYCPDEMTLRYHAVHADGSRRCWTCGCETPADVPDGL